MTETHQLLREYAEHGNEPAFQELVERYVDLVFSVARRRVDGDAHLAEDVAQTVFADLARKARQAGEPFGPPPVRLGGWLHRHTCFVAANLMRAAHRRQQRETQAVEMSAFNESDNDHWRDLAPELDAAVNQLAPADRDVILLRFYEHRDLRAVGAALGVSGDAAQKRVQRAVEKLRNLLARRGVTLSLVALSGCLADHAVTAAPAGLARQLSQTALAGAAAGGVGWLASGLRWAASTKGALLLGTVTVGLATFLLPAGKGAKPAAATADQPSLTADGQQAEAATRTARNQLSATTTGSENTISTSLEDRVLQLTILTADTGNPVPSVRVGRWILAGQRLVERKPLWANRFGRCRIPLPVGLSRLELTTRSDGFADTQLLWWPGRGETVPEKYTLRLDRAVPIGGSVVDADGQPVAGAEVRFQETIDPTAPTRTESHFVGAATTITDVNGHWRINWIAEELIARLQGRASHFKLGSSKYIYVKHDPETERQLRAQEFVFHLRRGSELIVRGVVVNENDQPIAGATVFVGSKNFTNGRTGKTAPDGTFVITGCSPQPGLVTAEADGYAPATVAAKIVKDMPPIRLVLKPGKALRLRVVDSRGLPIEGARLKLHTLPFPPGVPYTNPPPPQVRFAAKSDSEGRVVWKNAPDQQLSFDVIASGYLWRYGLKFRPDGQEHEIELSPALLVEGTVRDAKTGEPIPRFRMFCGRPEKRFEGNPPAPVTRPKWSGQEPFLLDFTGGKFHHLMEDFPLSGMRNPSCYFKFEAEGYAPQVTRLIAADEGIVRLDVRLEPVTETVVTVRFPNGQPAAHIQVGLAYPGAKLVLEPGGFSPHVGTAGDALRHTDAAGRFRLSADTIIEKVIAACPLGYAEATPERLATDPVLQLAPWGRVTGTFTRHGKPVAGIRLRVALKTIDWDAFSLDINSFQTKTDAAGQFIFVRVPPGIHWLKRPIENPAENKMADASDFSLRQVEVRAGETTEVQLGSGGYSVMVRPGWPQNLKLEPTWRIYGTLASPAPQPPGPSRNNSLALAQWRHRPEIRAARAERFSWPLETDGDGIWFAEGLPPGRYVVRLWAVDPLRKTAGARAERAMTIPDDPPTGQLDLGEIPLQPVE